LGVQPGSGDTGGAGDGLEGDRRAGAVEFAKRADGFRAGQFVAPFGGGDQVLAGELSEKWNFLLSTKIPFENDQRRAVQEVASMAESLVNDLESQARKFKEAIGELVVAAAKPFKDGYELIIKQLGEWGGDKTADTAIDEAAKVLVGQSISTPGIDIAKTAALAAETIEFYQQAAAVMNHGVTVYQGLVQSEKGSVLRLFTDTRADVDRYLADNGIDKAEKRLIEAKDAIIRWAGAVATTGQKNDAEAFQKEVVAALEADWKVTTDIGEKFKAAFSGAFAGPLGDETIDQLVDVDLVEAELAKIDNAEVPAIAEKWAKFLQDVPDAAVASFLLQFNDLFASTPDVVREAAALRSEEVQRLLRQRLKEHIDKMVLEILKLKQNYDAAQLHQHFSREELRNALE